MLTFRAQIDYSLECYHRGDVDEAFHSLVELDARALPELTVAFRTAGDRRLREFLLNVIWQHRQQSTVPLLAEALLDSEPRVWREALDGLVVLASPASLEALQAARGRGFPQKRHAKDFRRRLEEAIEQANVGVQRV